MKIAFGSLTYLAFFNTYSRILFIGFRGKRKSVRILNTIMDNDNDMDVVTGAVKQNLLFCLVTLVYVKGTVTICDYFVHRKLLPADISRKIIHIAAGSWCLLWPYFDDSHWTWKLNVFVPGAYILQLLAKGLILRDPNDPDVRAMSRSGKPVELLYGPVFFCCVAVYCGLYQFRTELGTYIMASLTYGDGIAPLIGKRYPFGRYPTIGKNETKTLSGSVAMFLSNIVGIAILSSGIGSPKTWDTATLLGISLVATVAEGLTGLWDNIAIAVSVCAFCYVTEVKMM